MRTFIDTRSLPPRERLAYFRDRRPEKCRRDLANPTLADRSADIIARSWGFPGGAYLSRLFQATYGMPSRDFRNLHRR